MAEKVPPVPTQAPMTDENGIISPVWADFFTQMHSRVGGSLGSTGDWATSKASNGYQKFPSGIVIQWGTTASIASEDTGAVTFPVAFETSCLQVMAEIKDNSAESSASTGHHGTGAYSTTGFSVYNRTDDAHVFNWWAIGY